MIRRLVETSKGALPLAQRHRPTNPANPFPHPEGRAWHPMAASFSQLLLLVLADDPDKPNQWRDDVVHYLTKGAHTEDLPRLRAGIERFLHTLRGESS